MGESNRPAQKSQPSRKGKKAWRKHIDLDDVDEGLEEARQLERTLGTKDITSLDQSDLFTVDTQGDEGLKSKKDRENLKPLKADEILSRRSAVPALKAAHKKASSDNKKKNGKIQGVSGKELNRLMRVAGRDGNKSSAMATLESDGIIKHNNDLYDAWGDEPEVDTKSNLKSATASRVSYSKATVIPSTLTEAPEAVVPNAKAVDLPDAGRSYNPSIESWKDLLERENLKEEEREKQRIATKEEKERIEHLIATLDVKEVDSDSSEGENSEDEETNDQADDLVSVNKPVKVKTKTKTQRNKQKRHLERTKLQEQLKALKQQLRDLENLPRLLQEEAEKQKKREEERATAAANSDGKKRKKVHTRHSIIEPGLDIKLSDELEDCLRRLKPEGNLARDRFRSLQERGLIEARVPVAKKRKYTPKVTEKWSYKDIKL
ncbi:Nop53p [Sugiyamaella lignohabitans]|uniref:Ribosome biogenesis protein NOP53 n=1 Tax=Sugiyamaella lignohabitans TaxID=796027 RepID=A0A167CI60_9ASCO|nr:Nop53p [Sugiyamaella lignohabitans]ANB11732.1 Nop53p [Sugiyamaella lignohabitans]